MRKIAAMLLLFVAVPGRRSPMAPTLIASWER